MVATEANGQPAAVAGFRGEPYGVAVPTVAEDGIVAITLFGDPTLAETSHQRLERRAICANEIPTIHRRPEPFLEGFGQPFR